VVIDLPKEFGALVAKYKLDFLAKGVLDNRNNVWSLGTDTKVISTIFELFARPLVHEIAAKYGYTVQESSSQTIYPDFTLMKTKSAKDKIAIDVKTTYRRSGPAGIGFTLGSYTSFLRNNTKNIEFTYDEYVEHWVLGFVYTRNATAFEVRPLKEQAKINLPYTNVEWFAQEKYRIAGESPGSGNTTNIASIRSNSIAEFVSGNGPFAPHGEAVFKEYWANYGKVKDSREFRNVEEFLAWKKSLLRNQK